MRITGVTNLTRGAERVNDLCGVGERKAREMLEAVHEEPIGVVLGEDVTLSQREVISLLVDAGLEVDAERRKVTEGCRIPGTNMKNGGGSADDAGADGAGDERSGDERSGDERSGDDRAGDARAGAGGESAYAEAAQREGGAREPLSESLTSWGRPVLVVRPRGGCEELDPGTAHPRTAHPGTGNPRTGHPGAMGEDRARGDGNRGDGNRGDWECGDWECGDWECGDWERRTRRKVRCREWTLCRWVQELWAAPGRTWRLAGSIARETPLRSWVRIFERGDHVRLGRCIVDLQWMKAEGIETSPNQPGVSVLIQTALDAVRAEDPRAYLRGRMEGRQDDDGGSGLPCEDAAEAETEPETERVAPHLEDPRSRSGALHTGGRCRCDDSTAHRKAAAYIARRVFPKVQGTSGTS